MSIIVIIIHIIILFLSLLNYHSVLWPVTNHWLIAGSPDVSYDS